MNERIRELADKCFSTLPHEDELEKFAELVIQECLIEFYRQCFDDEGEDITVQVNRYIEDLFRSDDRLDKIEALLRKQANDYSKQN